MSIQNDNLYPKVMHDHIARLEQQVKDLEQEVELLEFEMYEIAEMRYNSIIQPLNDKELEKIKEALKNCGVHSALMRLESMADRRLGERFQESFVRHKKRRYEEKQEKKKAVNAYLASLKPIEECEVGECCIVVDVAPASGQFYYTHLKSVAPNSENNFKDYPTEESEAWKANYIFNALIENRVFERQLNTIVPNVFKRIR